MEPFIKEESPDRWKCLICSKLWLSRAFLVAHLERKHPDSLPKGYAHSTHQTSPSLSIATSDSSQQSLPALARLDVFAKSLPEGIPLPDRRPLHKAFVAATYPTLNAAEKHELLTGLSVRFSGATETESKELFYLDAIAELPSASSVAFSIITSLLKHSDQTYLQKEAFALVSRWAATDSKLCAAVISLCDEQLKLLPSSPSLSSSFSASSSKESDSPFLVSVIDLIAALYQNASQTPQVLDLCSRACSAAIGSLLSRVEWAVQNALVRGLLAPLLANSEKLRKEYALVLWEKMLQMKSFSLESCELSYAMLCRFFNSFFGSHCGVELRSRDELWCCLFDGLIHSSSSIRKNCNYLLKRLLDTCKHEKEEKRWSRYFLYRPTITDPLFDTFFLLYETIDEFTIHLLQAAWSQVGVLMRAKEEIHPAWISVLYHRCLTHENSTGRKLALITLFATPNEYIGRIESSLILGPVLTGLSEGTMFRGVGGDTLPDLAVKFQEKYIQTLSTADRISFLRQYIHNVNAKVSAQYLQVPLDFLSGSGKGDDSVFGVLDARSFHDLCSLLNTKIPQAGHSRGRFSEQVVETVMRFAPLKSDRAILLEGLLPLLYELGGPRFFKDRKELWSRLSNFAKSYEIESAACENLLKRLESECDPRTPLDPLNSARVLDIARVQTAQVVGCTFVTAEQRKAILERVMQLFIRVDKSQRQTVPERLLLLYGMLTTSSQQDQTIKAAIDAEFDVALIRYLKLAWPDADRFAVLPQDTQYALQCVYIYSLALCGATKLRNSGSDPQLRSFLSEILKTQFETLQKSFLKGSRDADLNEFRKLNAMTALHTLITLGELSWLEEKKSDLLLVSMSAEIERPKTSPGGSGDPSQEEARSWNTKHAAFYLQKWELIHFVLSSLPNQEVEKLTLNKNTCSKVLLQFCTSALDGATEEFFGMVLESIKLLLPHLLREISSQKKKKNSSSSSSSSPSEDNDLVIKDLESLVEEVLSQTWSSLRDKLDLNRLVRFLPLAFQPLTMSLKNLQPLLKQMFAEVIAAAEHKGYPAGPYLAAYCCDVWNRNISLAHQYMAEMMELIVFGPNKTGMDFRSPHSFEFADIHLSDGSLQRVWHNDAFVRALVFDSIFRLSQQKDSEDFVGDLLEELFAENVRSSKKNHKPFSALHRRNIRLLQAMCLLVQQMTPKHSDRLDQLIWESTPLTHMKSVRQYLELFIVNYLLKFPHRISESFFKLLSDPNGTLEVTSSALVIGREVLCLLPRISPLTDAEKLKVRATLFEKVFNMLLPYSNCGNQLLRSQAQAAILKLMEDEKFASLISLHESAMLLELRKYLQTNTDCQKALQRYATLFGNFDAASACAWPEALLSIIPTREDLPAGEAIPMIFLKQLNMCRSPKPLPDPLSIEGEGNLIRAEESAAASSSSSSSSSSASTAAEKTSSSNTFQKKIEPWSSIQLDDALNRESVLIRRRQDLIVCASLIDKVPNLAGLARTSEVFSASCLVVPNARVAFDPVFQGVSVTAEKWIPIVEVTEENLSNWLTQKKHEGYSLLGLEQTSNSVNMLHYEFPRKAVLLLGKEKEGIPVEFLHLLDQCIQIPQLGLIRSLNVHVSGAITIWEFTRQGLLKQEQQYQASAANAKKN